MTYDPKKLKDLSTADLHALLEKHQGARPQADGPLHQLEPEVYSRHMKALAAWVEDKGVLERTLALRAMPSQERVFLPSKARAEKAAGSPKELPEAPRASRVLLNPAERLQALLGRLKVAVEGREAKEAAQIRLRIRQHCAAHALDVPPEAEKLPAPQRQLQPDLRTRVAELEAELERVREVHAAEVAALRLELEDAKAAPPLNLPPPPTTETRRQAYAEAIRDALAAAETESAPPRVLRVLSALKSAEPQGGAA